MKKFVIDLLLFAAINCLFAGLLYARYRVADDYLAAVNDKLDRMERTSPPRILLCGGSSVAWSSHSQLIKDTVGMDVQNLAYHAGLGLSMRINEAKMLAKPGDVLVMSIEWAVLSDKPRSRIMAESILACPRSFQFANWRDKKLVMDGLLPAIRMPFASLVNDLKEQQNFSAFSVELARKRKKWRLRENFNEFGDFQGHYEERRIGFAGRPIYFPTLDELETSIDRLNELHEWCNEHSVRMFYFIPLIPERYYLENEDLVKDYVNHLSKLTCPILNADHVYLPDESFFDSAYHLCKIAGEERSQFLADRLATLVSATDR